MSATAALAIGAGAAGLLGGLFNSQNQASISRENLRLQKENLDWQKHVQQKTWDREDTAIQRQKQDLIAAGMNPYMAMNGSGANSGSIVNTQAPQMGFYKDPTAEFFSSLGGALDMYKSLQQAKQSALETEYMKYNLWSDFGVNHPYSTFSWDGGSNMTTTIHDRWSLPKNIGDVRNSFIGRMNANDYERLTKENEGIGYRNIGLGIQNDILKVDRDFQYLNNISSLLLDGISAYGRIRTPYFLKPNFQRR